MGVYHDVTKEPKALDLLVERIKNDTELLHVAKQIVRIWYISQFKESSDPSNKIQVYAGHWKEGKLWDVIKAHPPAYSDQPHGYWKDKPEGT